mmetsp:Transcript_37950/g.81106  ORF Transcript_37950/g.81106 Transcript_37950/m.81106 type:complete len:121 (-) Transcript_37950:479-841(-)
MAVPTIIVPWRCSQHFNPEKGKSKAAAATSLLMRMSFLEVEELLSLLPIPRGQPALLAMTLVLPTGTWRPTSPLGVLPTPTGTLQGAVSSPDPPKSTRPCHWHRAILVKAVPKVAIMDWN